MKLDFKTKRIMLILFIIMGIFIFNNSLSSQSIVGEWERPSDDIKSIYYVLSLYDDGKFVYKMKSTMSPNESVYEGTYKIKDSAIIIKWKIITLKFKIIKLDQNDFTVTWESINFSFTRSAYPPKKK